MQKQVLDIGNCGPDHAAIGRMLRQHFSADVHQADQFSDAARFLVEHSVDLILVNRKLDVDYSDGLDVIRQLKADPRFASIPTMLITNYDEHQLAAVELGAQRGFGKLELEKPTTHARLAAILA